MSVAREQQRPLPRGGEGGLDGNQRSGNEWNVSLGRLVLKPTAVAEAELEMWMYRVVNCNINFENAADLRKSAAGVGEDCPHLQ